MKHELYQSHINRQFKHFKNRRNQYSHYCKAFVRATDSDSFAAMYTMTAVLDVSEENAAISHLTMRMVIIEWLLRLKGNPVIFIDTPSLADALYYSKFSIDSDDIALPGNQNMSYFSFPAGLCLDGVDMQGCFFGTGFSQSDVDHFRRLCGDNVDIHLLEIFPPFDSFYFMGWRNRSGDWFFAGIDKFNLQSLLCGDMDSVFIYEGEMSNKPTSTGLTYWRICAAVCIYAQAFPEYVKKGFPESAMMKKKEIKNLKLRPITLSFPEKKEGGSKSMHLRRWHFRSLKAECYERHEDGSIKVIFVRGSVINGTVDPTTILAGQSDESNGG